MHGTGLNLPVWQSDRIVAGTLTNGMLVIKTRQPDGTYLIDTIPLVKQEAA